MNKWFCITIGSPDSEPDLLPPLIMLLIRSKGGKITIVYSILRLRQRCIKTLPSSIYGWERPITIFLLGNTMLRVLTELNQ
jgi:hypothetical protein